MQDYESHNSMESDQTSHLNYTFPNHRHQRQPHHHQLTQEESMRSEDQSKTHITESSSSSEIKAQEYRSEIEQDSMDSSSFDSGDIEKIVAEILCIDSNGKLLPYTLGQIKSLQTVWDPSTTIPSTTTVTTQSVHQQDFGSHQNQTTLEPIWLKNLRESVLFEGSRSRSERLGGTADSEDLEEPELVFEIQQNLRSLVNNLNEDQWLYASPTAFSPSLSIQSNSLNLGLEGTTSEMIKDERYLETDFNLHSLPSTSSSDSTEEANLLPPRQLWLGEEEDQGLESDVSLVDLLNTTPMSDHHPRHPNLSGGSSAWKFHSRRTQFQQRHAQGSALARQVSRLGMSE